MEPGLLLFILFLTAAAPALAAKTVRVVPQTTVMVVERFGRLHKLADSGLRALAPFLDKPRGVHWAGLRPGLSSSDLREQFLDLPPQAAITRDNVQMGVDAVVYWQITDPLKSVYEVVDLVGGIVQPTITGMRAAPKPQPRVWMPSFRAVTYSTPCVSGAHGACLTGKHSR